MAKTMSQLERELTLKVIDGRAENVLFVNLYQIHHHTRAEEILAWLVRNNLCGLNFIGFLKHQHLGSILNLMAYVVKRIDRDVVKRPIIAGRDWA